MTILLKPRSLFGEPLDPDNKERARKLADLPPARNVRVSAEDDQECIVGEYSDIKNKCPSGSAAHHVIPDMIYRWSKRPVTMEDMDAEAIAVEEDDLDLKGGTIPRIMNSPSFNSGAAICLTAQQHGRGPSGVHGILNAMFKTLPQPYPGLAKFGDVREASFDALDRVEGLSDDCKKKAEDLARSQGGMGDDYPARITNSIPTDDAIAKMRDSSWDARAK